MLVCYRHARESVQHARGAAATLLHVDFSSEWNHKRRRQQSPTMKPDTKLKTHLILCPPTLPAVCVCVCTPTLDVQLSDIEAVRAGLSSESARFLTLTQMDDLWCQHLENMNLLKESVSMEVYRGRNPLEEFAAQVRASRVLCGGAAHPAWNGGLSLQHACLLLSAGNLRVC